LHRGTECREDAVDRALELIAQRRDGLLEPVGDRVDRGLGGVDGGVDQAVERRR